jgi:predicted  nucleic acid-binding Zn-ribbon protein
LVDSAGWTKGGSVGQTLDKLYELHKYRVILHRLQEKARSADVAINARKKQVARLKAELDRLATTRRSGQSAADRKELEARSLQEKINKFRNQLNEAKTNKEYQALQNEIKFAGIEKARIEDQVLAEMDKVEKQVAESERAKAAVTQAENELAALEAEKAAEVEALQADIRKAERDCGDLAREIPADVMQQYNRVASRYEEDALCPIVVEGEGNGDAAYSCGGCFMRLTQNVYVKLRGNHDELLVCPSCTRILFLEA